MYSRSLGENGLDTFLKIKLQRRASILLIVTFVFDCNVFWGGFTGHPLFACGLPPYYYTSLHVLSFGKPTGSGVFT